MRCFFLFLLSSFWVAISFAADFSVTPEKLTAEINLRKTKIIEFKQLHDYGMEHGFRIWIAGGSAAALAHYVKEDLENELAKSQGKEPIYFEGRYGYNYFDIYRSTQDCDIIINGTEKQAQELELYIREKFNHIGGLGTIFEVRLLDKSRGEGPGEKEPMLNNPNFLNQHTDSHSTGIIELTQPPVTESAVRDLFDWNNQKDHRFLLDVIANQLTYYFSEKHNTTKRFRAGNNPPIISVLRYYTKLFQYGLKSRQEDEKHLLKIINEFDPRDVRWGDNYVNKQINKNGIKMIRHARDMEFAIDTITRLGLKDKLLKFEGSKDKAQEQVRWWVNKEPLRSFPLGGKPGKTARELGITIVTHETYDPMAYESITMARQGIPNVFISRKDTEGEKAVHGDGFYTYKGDRAWHGTGFNIKYEVHPDAVEGADFVYDEKLNFVMFKNGSALKLIYESVKLSPVEYFQTLFETNIEEEYGGAWKRIELQFKARVDEMTKEELDQIVILVKKELVKEKLNSKGLREWFELDVSTSYWDVLEVLPKDGNNDVEIIIDAFRLPNWARDPRAGDFIRALINRGKVDVSSYLVHIFAKSYWMESHPDLVLEYVEKIFESGEYEAELIDFILTQPFWVEHPLGIKIIESIAMNGKRDWHLDYKVLKKDFCQNNKRLFQLSGKWGVTAAKVREGLLRERGEVETSDPVEKEQIKFVDIDEYEKILSTADPRARVEETQKLVWNNLLPNVKASMLEYVKDLNNSFEIGAYIQIAKESNDNRWVPILESWISQWEGISRGWQKYLLKDAQAALDAMPPHDCSKFLRY